MTSRHAAGLCCFRKEPYQRLHNAEESGLQELEGLIMHVAVVEFVSSIKQANTGPYPAFCPAGLTAGDAAHRITT